MDIKDVIKKHMPEVKEEKEELTLNYFKIVKANNISCENCCAESNDKMLRDITRKHHFCFTCYLEMMFKSADFEIIELADINVFTLHGDARYIKRKLRLMRKICKKFPECDYSTIYKIIENKINKVSKIVSDHNISMRGCPGGG